MKNRNIDWKQEYLLLRDDLKNFVSELKEEVKENAAESKDAIRNRDWGIALECELAEPVLDYIIDHLNGIIKKGII